MAHKKAYPLFLPNGCLSAKAIEAYVAGGVSPDARIKIEAHMQACDFCREAIEGVQQYGSATHVASVNRDLQAKVNARVEKEKPSFPARTVLLVAASIAILVSFWLIYQQVQNTSEPGIAVTENQETLQEETRSVEKDLTERSVSPPGEPRERAQTREKQSLEDALKAVPAGSIPEAPAKSPPTTEYEKEEQTEAAGQIIFEEDLEIADEASNEADNVQPMEDEEEFSASESVLSAAPKKAGTRASRDEYFESNRIPERRQEIPVVIPAAFLADTISSYDQYILYRLQQTNQQHLLKHDITVAFTVNELGKISEPEIDSTASEELHREIRSILQASPDWKPATRDGRVIEERIGLTLRKK